MDFIASLVTGITIKLYDDISDNKIAVHEGYIELLKTLQVIGLTAISIHDFNFSASICLLNILSFMGDTSAYLTDHFHKSILYLYPLVVLISFNYMSPVNIISVLYILCFIFFFTVEPHVIKEEYSQRKGILRLITSIVVLIGLFVGKYLGVSTSFLKLGTICLGYIFMSTIFQFYMLEKDNDKLLQTLVLHS